MSLLRYASTAYADYRLRVDWPESRRVVLEAYWSLVRGRWGEYTPIRYRPFVVVADVIILGSTRIGILIKRFLFSITRGRIRSRFARGGRVAKRP